MIVEFKDVKYVYNENRPNETVAINGINLEINRGDFIGLIGHTGSGKSTLIQLINGLYKPSFGDVITYSINTKEKGDKLKTIRQKVGMVFQYPEHQLFEETVFLDIAFGPKNMGLDKDEIEARVKDAMNLVGLDYESLKDKSPFNLSGGQKRRVAIAGVLAMHPHLLILDEPTAGLDPRGREEILGYIKKLHDDLGITIILVTHSMEEASELANRILVVKDGKILLDDKPIKVFENEDKLNEIGLDVPEVTSLMRALGKKFDGINTDILNVEDASDEIMKYFGDRNV
ncbi:energy-coupling factor transporter ATPase [Citroniella saccharovorans]|uniref:energy-coupling factor transporter ATPase n=1 Tax=Citroniella saccharovorans TaxID=2053367 RepID=UPI003619849C